VRAQRAALHEPRSAPLRKADVDDIEVPRHDSLREDRPRLPGQLRSEVTARDVRQDEQPDRREPRDLGGLGGGRMSRLLRSLALFLPERRVVNENIGLVRDLENRPHRASVARDDDAPPEPRRTEHLLRPHGPAAGKLDRLPALKPPVQRARRDTERTRRRDVEPTRTRLLDERIPLCRDVMVRLERDDPVVGARDPVTRPQLLEDERVRELPEHPP
jgi:hypothetical protein